MKKLLTAFFFIIIAFSAFGQLSNKVDTLKVKNLTVKAQAGVTAPLANTNLHVSGANSQTNYVSLDAYGNSPILAIRQANGTQASPTASSAATTLGGIQFFGYGATGYSSARSSVLSSPTETWTDSAQGTSLRFLTTATGGTSSTVRMFIDGNGSVSIGNGATAANTSAIIDVTSTSKGFLPPRMTTAQKTAIALPAAGLEVFDTTTEKINFYNGSAWVENVMSSSDGVIFRTQATQTTESAAITLTVAKLRTQIIQYTGVLASLQLPTGTDIQTSIGTATDVSFDFSVINTGSGVATLTTNTGLTLTGSMAVTNGASGTFRLRRTGTNTATIYRLN